MESEVMKMSNDLDVLRLCPDSEETLNELASAFIRIIRVPKGRIRKTEREKAETILSWCRRIIKFGSCLGLNQLSGIDCVESLYDNEATYLKCLSHFKDMNDCLVLGKYIVISCLSSEQKSSLLTQITKNLFHLSSVEEEEEVASFLCMIWALRDEIPLTAETLEELIQGFPLCIEQFLMDIVERVISVSSRVNVDAIINSELISFCVLCATSHNIFQTVLSILHEFLLISDVNEYLFYFITSFFSQVKYSFRKDDFVDLFPFELRILVTFLQFEPSLYPEEFIDNDFNKNNVLNTLTHFIFHQRREGGALMSYYPEWLPHIFHYCIQNNVFELIPRNKDSGDRKESYLKFVLQSVM